MAERWEQINQLAMPLDKAMGAGLDLLKVAGLYDPFRDKLYGMVKAMQRSGFERDNALEIVGLENVPEGGALLACNHQSWLDVQVIVASMPRRVHFMAKAMFEEWPFLHHLIDLSDSPYIRRGGDSEGMNRVVDALREGKLVCIFPEGTIPGEEDMARWEVEPDTGLLRGKTGVVRLAIEAGVPIVPLGVSGTGKALPPEAYPRLQQPPMKRKVPITLKVGEPIRFDGKKLGDCNRDDLRKMTKQVMKAISSLVDTKRNHVPTTLPLSIKTEPDRVPPYALRSPEREATGKDGKKAKVALGALVLHGFTSHISCVSSIEPLLKGRGVPYRFPTLRGHGGEPRDLIGVTAKDWYEDAENALLDLLQDCEKVVIIGHSMGGAVALDLAAHHNDKVAAVIPVAPALKFADPLAGLTPLLAKVVTFWKSPNAYNDKASAAKNKNYPKFPTAAFNSLYHYGAEVLNRLSFIKVPTYVLQSRKDKIVSPRSAELVKEKVSSSDRGIIWFEKIGHEMFLDKGAEEVLAEVDKLLDRFIPA